MQWPQVVVVLSGSMEPGFFRGDILFLYQSNAPVRTGEIVVFKLDHRKREPGHDDIPIVHRAVTVHEREPGGMINILTKGEIMLSTSLSAMPSQARGGQIERPLDTGVSTLLVSRYTFVSAS